MKKTLLIFAILLIGVTTSFAFTVVDNIACPYQSSVSKTVTCNLAGVYVTAQTVCTKYGTSYITATRSFKIDGQLISQVSFIVSSQSFEGSKQASWGCWSESWVDHDGVSHEEGDYFTSFKFELTNPYGGPQYTPGECWAMVYYN